MSKNIVVLTSAIGLEKNDFDLAILMRILNHSDEIKFLNHEGTHWKLRTLITAIEKRKDGRRCYQPTFVGCVIILILKFFDSLLKSHISLP